MPWKTGYNLWRDAFIIFIAPLSHNRHSFYISNFLKEFIKFMNKNLRKKDLCLMIVFVRFSPNIYLYKWHGKGKRTKNSWPHHAGTFV